MNVETDPLVGENNANGLTNDRPLFGDRLRNKDRLINYALIATCGLLLVVTIVTLAVVKFNAVNLITAFVIVSVTGSNATLIYWYRLGDLDPKFRYLIIWHAVNLCTLCIVAIIYYHTINK